MLPELREAKRLHVVAVRTGGMSCRHLIDCLIDLTDRRRSAHVARLGAVESEPPALVAFGPGAQRSAYAGEAGAEPLE